MLRLVSNSVQKIVPAIFTGSKAAQKDKNVPVEWTVANERQMAYYEIEASTDGIHFNTIGKNTAINNGSGTYQFIHKEVTPGQHYYRVKGVDVSGQVSYSAIAKVLIAAIEISGPSSISIYPNPVVNGVVSLQLTNQPAGVYGLRLLNPLGQVILSKKVIHAEGSSTQKIDWDYKMAHGMYQLEITKPGGQVHVIKVMY